jgi:hypothetical protein
LWFVGHNINALYDYQYMGLWQAGDAYQNILEPGTPADVVGSIKVLYTGGYNADGSPVRAIGQPIDKLLILLQIGKEDLILVYHIKTLN